MSFDYMVMKSAYVAPTAHIGHNCIIWGVVGENCNIQCNTDIFVGVELENDVFVGPNVTFTNVKHPTTKGTQKIKETLVKRGASIGANATILCGITLGEYCVVGAGAVVTKNVKPHTTVVGNPAHILKTKNK